MKLRYAIGLCSIAVVSISCAAAPYTHLSEDVAAAKNPPASGQDVRATEAKFCAAAADNLQTRAQFNQNWAIFITGLGAVATAAGSGTSLVAAQMKDGSPHKSEVLQGGAISTALGLAALGLAAIFDWNGLSKSQRVASASMAESSTRILSSAPNSADEQSWYSRCTDSAVKLAENIPNVSPPAPNSSTGTGGSAGADMGSAGVAGMAVAGGPSGGSGGSGGQQ